ncbi:adenylate/guanylate cyclase domain-containing protein [Paraliomyxa miuraensis]|uniref:adenylate/guanylate cyclase domain-containing protein n=1 Tax=Paraliomyxa miuraensis TaxID=376150 RepID=UPI00224F8F99|nr:adenylate/guanylate cyclase domain-containing protein [Paraliomyxa miuraensis]MCX4241380.1 adenylate/guanylate cyclase domain-containing protein [Paraliomyxa miuraensis]
MSLVPQPSEIRPTPADSIAGATSVSLLVRPELRARPIEVALPSPRRVSAIYAGAIAIGSTAAAVGAYYITLSVVFPPGVLAFFLAGLGVLVGLSIGVTYLLHRRLTRALRAWLQDPDDMVDLGAWHEALNYPVFISIGVGMAALGVSLLAASVTGLYAESLSIGMHIAVGGLLASLLDAVFVWLYTDHCMAEVLRAMAARNPLLPVSGRGIVSLGLAAKMAIVIVGVSVVGAVVAGTLAYRGAEQAVQSGDISGLALELLVVTAAGLAVSLSGCLLVARHITGPVEELTRMLAELCPERYGMRALPRNSDEAGQLMVAVNQMLDGLEEREFIKDALSRYVTHEVTDTVLQGGLNLGGELLEVTVLMADIRGFTLLTESLPPRRLVRLLNRYFTAMVDECEAQGGFIDKFIGDAIMVVFGAPVVLPARESALRAARAAVGMRRRLVALNEKLEADGMPTLQMGIGVHSGEAIAGNIGAPQRLDYTVIGDSVNVCARIESTCKVLGQDILISEATRDLLGDEAVVSDPYDIQLRGKSQSTRVMALLDLGSARTGTVGESVEGVISA